MKTRCSNMAWGSACHATINQKHVTTSDCTDVTKRNRSPPAKLVITIMEREPNPRARKAKAHQAHKNAEKTSEPWASKANAIAYAWGESSVFMWIWCRAGAKGFGVPSIETTQCLQGATHHPRKCGKNHGPAIADLPTVLQKFHTRKGQPQGKNTEATMWPLFLGCLIWDDFGVMLRVMLSPFPSQTLPPPRWPRSKGEQLLRRQVDRA